MYIVLIFFAILVIGFVDQYATEAKKRRKKEEQEILKMQRRRQREQEMERQKQLRQEQRERERQIRRQEKEQDRQFKQEQTQLLKRTESLNKLNSRLTEPKNFTDLAHAVQDAKDFVSTSSVSARETGCFSAVHKVVNGLDASVVNVSIDKSFDDLRSSIMNPISFKETKKAARTWTQAVARAYDQLPKQSQERFDELKTQLYGEVDADE